jgi:BirA family biotin operon repressor/biotin-[acetyl-CoA-carboxylase] ligase
LVIKHSFDLARLRQGLAPFHLHWFPTLRSTSDHAAALRKRGQLFAPAVILTGRQTAGRGRGGNRWWSDQSVLTVTFALAAEEHLPPHELPLIAGLAVRAAAAEICGNDEIQLKWPNDILYRDRKLAGLLCERLDKLDLIGLGMNVNLQPAAAPRGLNGLITSLSGISGRAIDPTAALILIASQLRQTIQRRHRQPFGQFLSDYQKHHALLGRRVTIQAEANTAAISGVVEGIDAHARLLVRDKTRLYPIIAGHVVMH